MNHDLPRLTDFTELVRNEQAEEDERNRQRVERLSRYFTRVNSALTFRNISVEVKHAEINAPAWSGANDIVLNSRLINDFNNGISVANLRGLNFHELSHIMFTPRNGSEIVTWVNENKYRNAFNALEDQRIETLFTARFPSTRDWFVVTVLTYFVNDELTFKTSYPLLRGRRYLPLDVRIASREAFPHQDKVDELCEIIDQYRTLIYPIDTEIGKVLIERFHNALDSIQDPHGNGQGDGGNGEPKTVDYNDLADWEKELLGKAQEGDGKNGTQVLNCPMGHGERPTEGIESSASSRPQPAKQQKRDSERAKQLDKNVVDENKPQPKSDSQSNGGNSAGINKPLKDILTSAIKEIMDKSDVAKEITNIIRIANGLPSLSSKDIQKPTRATYTKVAPDTKTLQASQSFARELERLKAKFDPAWDKYESRGKLNAQRFLRGDDLDTVFDTWNEGREDVTEIECVILLDNSGSMTGRKATQAYRAMYAVKHSLDRIGANCSVVVFNSDSTLLYEAQEKAGNSIRDCGATGGTEPLHAISYATKLLAETEKPVKLFFAITDGEWSMTKECDDEIKKLSRAGVLTALAFIPSDTEQTSLTHEQAHFCNVASIIHNPFDLVGMARTIVKNAIGRRITANA